MIIQHFNSDVLEEDHYYPFGLTLNITPPSNGIAKNDIKFQGQMHEDDFGINMYTFKYREHDPQTGRFWQIDPLAESYVHNSTYAFSENKVTSHIELEGLEALSCADLWRAAGITSSTNARQFVTNVGVEVAKPENILQAYGQAGQIAIPVILTTIMTGGMGALPMLEADAAYVGAMETASTGRATTSAEATSAESVPLFRGVNENHPGYAEATTGSATPRGGDASPAEHNLGNTKSNYTSWTTDKRVAVNYALRPNGTGVVIETNTSNTATVASPSVKNVNLKQSPGTVINESEVLIKGPVTGARIVPFY